MIDLIVIVATIAWYAVMLNATVIRLTGFPVQHWRDNWLDRYGF